VKLMNQVANSRRDGEDSGNMVKKNILLGEPASPSQGTEFWHCYISLDRYPSLPDAKCKIFTGRVVFRVVLRLVMCFISPAHLSFPIFLVSPHPSSYFQLLKNVRASKESKTRTCHLIFSFYSAETHFALHT
jgi:hypothetical protein